MIIRSKAPLRLGLAGGGTDVSPYADMFGGSILNATINMYAHATIIPTNNKTIVLQALDIGEREEHESQLEIEPTGKLMLLKGVYNRIIKEYKLAPLSFELSTSVEAPAGSGLGSSSTLVVAILGAFVEWLNLPLGEYDIAHLAYEIERIDLNLKGGRQDQYAATFGGFNFMEFYKDDKVIVNPLRVKQKYTVELEHNLVLFYTGTSRKSADIIQKQVAHVHDKNNAAIAATHIVKEQSFKMKEAILTGKVENIGPILNEAWQAKKNMAPDISNSGIDALYKTAIAHGATGGKISGAGGGGFFFFYCPGNTKHQVIEALKSEGYNQQHYLFTRTGLYAYTLQ